MFNINLEKLLTKISTIYSTHDLIFNILISVLLIVGVSLFKRWYIKKLSDDVSLDERRRKLISFRNKTAALLVILLVVLWASELKTFTVSLLAIAVALVVATKEMILAAIGGILRTTTKKYTVGDRIEVKTLRGHVIDTTLLYTTIMEVGPGRHVQQYTGRTISFPNSLLLTEPIHVESFTGDCSIHSIQIPVYPEDANVPDAAKNLKLIADTVCEPYLDMAKTYVDHMQAKNAIDMPSHMPRVIINSDEKGEWWLTLRIVTPFKEKIKIEQDILTKYLATQKLLETTKEQTK